MADSTEEMRQEMERFERDEETESGGIRTQGPPPSGRKFPNWILWMLVADLVIVIAVVLIIIS